MREVAALAARVAELERRVAGMFRSGNVDDVDPAKQRVRLDLGPSSNGGRFRSPWVPYSQIGGALKAHTPPSKGQQMSLVSPSGNMQQAVAMPMTFSEENASPSQDGEANVITYGGFNISLTADTLTVSIGGSSIVVTGGSIEMNSPRIDLN